MEDLFNECANNTKYDTPKNSIVSTVEKLTTEIENNYLGLSTVFSEREKEKKDLKEKIAAAERKLTNIKNPANLAKMTYTRREAITKKLAESREELRKEIKIHKVRLSEIEVEEGKSENSTEPENAKNKNTKNRENNKSKEVRNNVDDILPASSKWNMNPYADFL